MINVELITVEDIKDYSPISASVSADLISPFITMAQTFHIKPCLGQTLYMELIDAVSGDTLSGSNYTLLSQYVSPALIWYSYYEAFPFIWSRTNAKGVTKGYSDSTTSLDKKEFEMMKQELLDRAVGFKNLMIDYLNDNLSTFPSYGTDGSSSKDNSSGIYLGKIRSNNSLYGCS